MARKRTYERDDVLENAMGLFWQKGFKASSMSDIVEVTGLNTASMYREFGDKDGLFEEALQYYRDNIMSHRLQLLIDEPNMRGVENFLNSVATGAARDGYRGCLMMNHIAQIFTISDKAAKAIGDFCARVEELLETALRTAQAEGDLPAGKEPAALASYIVCCVHGLVLYGRFTHNKPAIPNIYEDVMRTLRA